MDATRVERSAAHVAEMLTGAEEATMNTYTYRYYLLPSDAVVGVRQPECRYTHIGDLLSVREFVRVTGKQYDGSIGEYGIPADVFARAVEISPATAALHEPRLMRYIEAHRRQEGFSYHPLKSNERPAAPTARVLI